MPDELLRTILSELSVENSLKETAAIASRARYPNSQGFFDAAEYVAARAREYGLHDVRIERFPARTPMWDAAEQELAVVTPARETIPTVLAQNSADGDVTAELVEASSSDVREKWCSLAASRTRSGWPWPSAARRPSFAPHRASTSAGARPPMAFCGAWRRATLWPS